MAGAEPRVIASSDTAWLGKKLQDLPDDGRVLAGLNAALGSRSHTSAETPGSGFFSHFSPVVLTLPEMEGNKIVDAGILTRFRTHEIRTQVMWSVLILGGSITGGLLAVFGLAYCLFSLHVLKPLNSVERQLADGAPAEELDAGKSAGDQIGFVVAALKQSFLERNKQQVELRESEARFRQLADLAPVLVWIAGTDKGCIWFNQHWLEFTGRTLEQEAGHGWAEGVHPDDRQRCLDTYTSHFDRRAEFRMDYRLRRHDGEFRWVADHGIPRFAAGGEFAGYIGTCVDITERKEAETKLLRSEQLYRQLTEQVQDVIWVLDPETKRFRYISPSCLKMFGFTDQELLAAPFEETVIDPGEELKKVRGIIEEGLTAFLAGKIGPEDFLKTEIVNRCKDGSSKWVDISYNFQRNAETGRIEIAGVSRDTTERRRQEDALRTSEAKFRGLFEANRDAVVLADTSGKFLDANPAAVALYGCSSKEELFNQSPVDTAPPCQPSGESSAPIVAANHQRALNGETLTFDWVVRRIDDGGDVFCEVTLVPVEFEGRHCVLATLHDLTEKRAAEAALKLSEERHRLVAELAKDVIWTMELDGTVSYISPSVEKVRGFTPEECLRQSIEQTLIPESRPVVLSYMRDLQEVVAAGRRPQNFRGEQGYWRKDGSVFWADVIAIPLLRPDGTFVQLLGMSRDISEHKAMQQTMREARDAADAANRAKSEFLANMSHEIRTPMNAVIGLSNLLRESSSLDTQHKYAEQIHRAGTALLGVLDDVLDYSKIEAGQMQIESAPLHISELMHNCQAMFGLQAQTKRIALQFDIAPTVPNLLMGDPLRLLQVVKNLISNALKFTRQGSITVRVDHAGESAGKVLIKVSVRDTGIGMAPEQLQKIFTAFSQGDVSTTRRYGGTGLGLSISRRLVELMGGELKVDSVQGEGSTFSFTVRMGKAAGTGAARAIPGQAGSKTFAELAPVVARIRGARVLVVDDNVTNCLVAQQYLRKLGLVSESVNSGAEAVQKAKEGGFDAILLDLQMPVMDGYAVATIIREHEGKTGVENPLPIIALSAAAMAKDVEASMAAGMNDHIAKPIDPMILAKTLARWIAPRNAGGAS